MYIWFKSVIFVFNQINCVYNFKKAHLLKDQGLFFFLFFFRKYTHRNIINWSLIHQLERKKRRFLLEEWINVFYILINPRPNTKKPVPWDLKFHNFSYLSYQRGYSTLKNKCEFCIFPYELRLHTRTHNLGFYSYNRKLNAGNNIILRVSAECQNVKKKY